MTGAAMLAARASLRTGLGISVLATTPSALAVAPPEEIIYFPLPETADGSVALSAMQKFDDQLERASAYLIGPGMTEHPDTMAFMQTFIEKIDKPAIIDADALNAIAKKPGLKIGNASEVVITPHPKEMSRLLGVPMSEVQANRIATAERARDKFGCNIVLKGAHTVVATVDGTTWIIPCGNPGMATAGSGDVLSGIIGGLLAQGMPAQHAAVAGTYLHAAAGDLAAHTHGEDGMVASSITEALPTVLSEIRLGEFTGTELEEMILGM
jgi:NAD(P)H-hydrate epimerase